MTGTFYINEAAEIFTEDEVVEQFDQLLSETYRGMIFNGFEYPLGDCLKAVDPIAYREALSDYLSEIFWEVPSNFTPDAITALAVLVALKCSEAPEDYELWLSCVAAVREEFGIPGPRLEMF